MCQGGKHILNGVGTKINNNNRIIYIDILNILAIISVIALHCNSIVHGNVNIKAWNSSLIVECICYFAVPIFCMLSGATLMNYREKYDTKTFFKKRIIKVLIPFIFWAIIMFAWKIIIGKINLKQFNSIVDWINAFFSSKEETTYYFMFTILGIYLTMPLMSLVAKKENIKDLWFVVLIYFIFNSLIPNLLKIFKINYNTDLSLQIAGYEIFVLLGYLLSNQNISKKYRILIYSGALIGVLYRYITTFILSKAEGEVIKTTWGYTSWHSILLACSVFLFIKNLNFEKLLKNKIKIIRALSKISSCSFGIYLIHQIVMYYEKYIFIINSASWQWRTIGIVTTYLISLTIVLFLKRVPILKRVVP